MPRLILLMLVALMIIPVADATIIICHYRIQNNIYGVETEDIVYKTQYDRCPPVLKLFYTNYEQKFIYSGGGGGAGGGTAYISTLPMEETAQAPEKKPKNRGALVFLGLLTILLCIIMYLGFKNNGRKKK